MTSNKLKNTIEAVFLQKDNTIIKSIAKAVKVLKVLSLGNSRLSDIAREVEISKNGVFRILHSLKECGMVIQDPVNREYFLGPVIFEINGNPLRIHDNLINASYTVMDDLNRASGETVTLSIKFGMEQIYLRRLIGTHDVTYIGKANPIAYLWFGATGKVLLGQLSKHDLDLFTKYVTMEEATLYSTTNKDDFKQEIIKVKEKGYATSFNETEVGVASIATPVIGYIVPAALTITGPNDRLASHIEEYVQMLKDTAGKISKKIIRFR